jgi:hypothetical protein
VSKTKVTTGGLAMLHTHRHMRARVGSADLMVAAAAAAVADAEACGAGGGLGAPLVPAALAAAVRLAVERAALRALAAALPSRRTPPLPNELSPGDRSCTHPERAAPRVAKLMEQCSDGVGDQRAGVGCYVNRESCWSVWEAVQPVRSAPFLRRDASDEGRGESSLEVPL